MYDVWRTRSRDGWQSGRSFFGDHGGGGKTPTVRTDETCVALPVAALWPDSVEAKRSDRRGILSSMGPRPSARRTAREEIARGVRPVFTLHGEPDDAGGWSVNVLELDLVVDAEDDASHDRARRQIADALHVPPDAFDIDVAR